MKNLTFLLSKLDNSQLSYSAIDGINKLITDTDDVVSVITLECAHILKPVPFCTLLSREIFNIPGVGIATDIFTTRLLLNTAPRITNKYFYVWNLEWLYLPEKIYSFLADIYLNPNIELIAPCEEYYDVLAKVWKKPVKIIENFNFIGEI